MRAVIGIILFILTGPLFGGFLDGLDRKISARMQGRIGPPLLQPFYDLRKLFNKQIISVVDKSMSALLLTYLIMMVLSGAIFFAGNDILMSVFVLSTASTVLYFAAVITSSPYSTFASSREMIQIMAYEPAVLLACVGFYLATGSFRVSEIASAKTIMITHTPGFFLAFVFILLIKLRKSPFDVSTGHHAHQELVQGITTEMGSRNLAIFHIAEWYEEAYLFGFLSLFTINGNPWSIPVTIVMDFIVFFIMVLIDNTSARVKMGNMFRTAWLVTIMCAGINLLVLILIR